MVHKIYEKVKSVRQIIFESSFCFFGTFIELKNVLPFQTETEAIQNI